MTELDNYIERRAGHCGGYPMLKRFNMPVRVIIEMTRQVSGFSALCQAFPLCSPDELQAALAYYDANRALVDEDIARNQVNSPQRLAGKWPA